MRIPPNYGPQYTAQFGSVYTELARQKHVPVVAFFMSEVALHPDLMQADGVHPNEQGQPKLLASALPALLPLLKH
jgi:acyl-CoA thioesterase-1